MGALLYVHVAISLVGIASGFIVVFGMLTAKPLPGWTAFFLWTTVATSATGFPLPAAKFLPSHAIGILSLIALAIVQGIVLVVFVLLGVGAVKRFRPAAWR